MKVRDASGKLNAVRSAIARVRAVALEESDESRLQTCIRFDELFADPVADLRASARLARRSYRGGYGSFADTGTSEMGEAIETLRIALRRAARLW